MHTTDRERTRSGITPGDSYPVFAQFGLRFGIMTCYDGYFPESARILALQGATALFVPSLQRSVPGDTIELQVRARAYDNCVHVIRSGYGLPNGRFWEPGMIVGMSCIASPEGTIIGNMGLDTGFVARRIACSAVRPRRRSYGATFESPRDNCTRIDARIPMAPSVWSKR